MDAWKWHGQDVRSGGCVEENVSVLEVLGFRTVLEVLLETVAAVEGAHGRDGRLVDDVSSGGVRGHDCVWES